MSESIETCDFCGKEGYQWIDQDGTFICENCGEENCHPWMDEDEDEDEDGIQS